MEFKSETEKNLSELKYAIHGNFISQAIAAGCELEVFDHFNDINEELTLEKLAQKTNSHSYSLKKLLNFLVTINLLCISSDLKSYKITQKGLLLRKNNNPSLHYFSLLHSTSLFRKASDFLTKSIRNNVPGTSHFCEKGMFEFLSKNDKDSIIFNKAMADLTSIHANEIASFLSGFEGETIVDAGGGIGTLLCAILKKNPKLKGKIVDLPNLEKEASKYIESLGLSDRIFFSGKSFFKDFRENADIILLHHVLHDYDDKCCVSILKNCKSSLNQNGSILIIETLLGEEPEIGVGWLKDLIMHVITLGGRVRSINDFEPIFSEAGLKLERIHNLPLKSADISIIELKLRHH